MSGDLPRLNSCNNCEFCSEWFAVQTLHKEGLWCDKTNHKIIDMYSEGCSKFKRIEQDSFLEEQWTELTDVPFDEENYQLILSHDWWLFYAGTIREDIWRYFDKLHSKGVKYLLSNKS